VHDSRSSFAVVGNSLLKISLSYECFSCKKHESRIISKEKTRQQNKTTSPVTIYSIKNITNNEAFRIQPMIVRSICSGWMNNLQLYKTFKHAFPINTNRRTFLFNSSRKDLKLYIYI
jgi:hypothetical protein